MRYVKTLLKKLVNVQGAGIGLLGIPFDSYSSHLSGAAQAPELIRRALWSPATNLWAENGVNVGDEQLIFDAGDIDLSSEQDPFDRIEQILENIIQHHLVPVCLGGDHSVTIPVVRALKRGLAPFHILHFDAHPDLYESFQNNRYSHACPFARIMEDGLTDRLVQVGVRTINEHQQNQAERFSVEQITMDKLSADTVLSFDAPLYISLDIDALDPAFAPGVSHPEPGGLSTRLLLQLLHNLKAPAIVGVDIVEYNPGQDINNITAVVCAKLLKELVAKIIILGQSA